MRFGSLFAGIGGLDLGLERAGMQCRWQVEIDEWCRRVLAKHWPNVPRYADVRDVGAGLELVDLICGGFPCQPFSLAGRRRGTADERWMWPEFERVVRLLRPRYVLLENVPGLLAGDGMAEVLGDLAALGFDAEWECIPAAAVGAPHLRWRVFIVAYCADDRVGWRVEQSQSSKGSGAVAYRDSRGREGVGESGLLDGERPAQRHDTDGRDRALADAERAGLEERQGVGRDARAQQPAAQRDGDPLADADAERRDGRAGIFGSRWRGELADGSDALVDAASIGRRSGSRIFSGLGPPQRGWWSSEPDVGRVAYGVPARVERLRGLGNAVVPQVAEAVGRMIAEHAQR